jgi:hypothetical protein
VAGRGRGLLPSPNEKRRSEEVVLDEILAQKRTTQQQNLDNEISSLRLQISAIADRQNRLTDAYLDGVLAREEYEQRKTALITERCDLEDKLRAAERGESRSLADLEFYVELVKRAYLQYEHGLDDEKRDLLKDTMSNRLAYGKTIEITFKSPLSADANRPLCPTGGPSRSIHRTWEALIDVFTNPDDDHHLSPRLDCLVTATFRPISKPYRWLGRCIPSASTA